MAHKKRKSNEAVELNLAAMLDMAFQLLTFFILTFRPPPVEGQVTLRLPKPEAVATQGQTAGADTSNTNPVQGLNTLVVTVTSTPNGSIESLAVGEGGVPNLTQLDFRLRTVLSDPANPFEQVIIQVGSDLKYEALMSVIDVCTKQTLPSGEKLSKLSFVELPSAG